MGISSRVKILAYNILEEGTVAVAGETTGYPKARLYDRSLGFYWYYATSAALSISISANSLAVDTLIVEGHNWNTQTLSWDYSDNGSSWTTALSWVQSGNSQIVKQLTSPLTHAYWRVISSGAGSFLASEVFMGRMVSVPVMWENAPGFSEVGDVSWLRTYGGVDHSIRIGPKRKYRNYSVFMDRSSYPIATLRADFVYLDDYVKPFYFIDHEDNCFLAKFDNSLPDESHMNEGLLEIQFSVLEIPG